MEVQDGFIVGIFNYCDRWCERCAFTSRCSVFADVARAEAMQDPSMKEIVDAPAHPQDVREPPPWLAEAIDEMNKAVEQALATMPPPATASLNDILGEPYNFVSTRAKDYTFRVHEWWGARYPTQDPAPDDPASIILRFSMLIATKVFRALSGLVEFDGDRKCPPDHEGSAKVALIAIDRSIVAWHDLAAAGRVSAGEAKPFLNELSWLRETMDTLIPRARAFVRPAFDEPDAVATLEAEGD